MLCLESLLSRSLRCFLLVLPLSFLSLPGLGQSEQEGRERSYFSVMAEANMIQNGKLEQVDHQAEIALIREQIRHQQEHLETLKVLVDKDHYPQLKYQERMHRLNVLRKELLVEQAEEQIDLIERSLGRLMFGPDRMSDEDTYQLNKSLWQWRIKKYQHQRAKFRICLEHNRDHLKRLERYEDNTVATLEERERVRSALNLARIESMRVEKKLAMAEKHLAQLPQPGDLPPLLSLDPFI